MPKINSNGIIVTKIQFTNAGTLNGKFVCTGRPTLRHDSQCWSQLIGVDRMKVVSSYIKVCLKRCSGMHHEFVHVLLYTLLVVVKFESTVYGCLINVV